MARVRVAEQTALLVRGQGRHTSRGCQDHGPPRALSPPGTPEGTLGPRDSHGTKAPNLGPRCTRAYASDSLWPPGEQSPRDPGPPAPCVDGPSARGRGRRLLPVYMIPLISTDMLILLLPLGLPRFAAGSWRLSQAAGTRGTAPSAHGCEDPLCRPPRARTVGAPETHGRTTCGPEISVSLAGRTRGARFPQILSRIRYRRTPTGGSSIPSLARGCLTRPSR